MSEMSEKYTVTSKGMAFHKETAQGVVRAVELAREKRMRVRVWYGDVTTGKSWLDEFDIIGYVGRSTGTIQIPLIVFNERSMGGGAMLDHCVVRIDSTKGHTLYQHPKFYVPEMAIIDREEGNDKVYDNPYRYQVHTDTEHAAFETRKQAQKYIDFMNGKRYAK